MFSTAQEKPESNSVCLLPIMHASLEVGIQVALPPVASHESPVR